MALRLGFLGTGFMLAALALATPTLAADVVISDEARAHFAAGVNLLQDPDGARYEEAYREFKEAYARSPSWKILGNLGISAMKLERDSEAIEAFKKYLAEGGKQVDAEERAQFQRDLATLEAGAARLTLTSDPPGAQIEDERFPTSGAAVRNSYSTTGTPLQVGVRSGRHRFTAKLAGRADAVWEIELSPKQQESHAFVLPEAPVAAPAAAAPPAAPATAFDADSSQAKPSNALRTGSYIALGVGVVGIGVGTVFGLKANGKYKDANAITSEYCPATGDCELAPTQFDQREQLGKDGDSSRTLSIVGFALGGVGIATGVTLFILSNKKEQPKAAHVEPILGIGHVGVRGSF